MAWRGALISAVPSPVLMTRRCGCGTWRRGAACASSKATLALSGAWWSADRRRALSGSCGRTTVRLWDVETGRCLLSSKATRGRSGAWRGVPISVSPSPAPPTPRCGCGTWRRGAACACSKATRQASGPWRGAPINAVPSPATTVASGCGICRNLSPRRGTGSLRASLAARPGPGPIHERQSPPRRRERRGQDGLSMRLALNDWQPSDSTVGAWATQWKLPVSSGDGVEREIWLWDFGGQADQRLIHQLYMDETALAVLVFDGQKEDLFETLGQWDRDLTRASRQRSPSCWSPGAWMPAACASAGARSKPLRKNAAFAISGNQRQGQPRLRGTQAGHPRRHPVGGHSVALLAAALQAAQGGDRPPQGRRPGADALQRAAGDAATALVGRSHALHRRRTESGGESAGRSRRGVGAEVRQLGAAPAGAHQCLRPSRDPDDARG